MRECGAINPEVQDSVCYLKGPHGTHSDRQDRTWPNSEVEEREKIRSAHSVKGGRGKKKQPSLVSQLGPLAKSRNENLAIETGIPSEAVTKWNSEPWKAEATKVFREFLRTHSGQFTTAEDLWPLLDRPEEMRALSIVTQQMLRQGSMEEVGSKRLRGVYSTKDGHRFAENKLVPIYQSLICQNASD